jgi:serine/threonine protein kinase
LAAKSWDNLQEIYALPMIKSHKNILPYIGAEQRGTQFWLITEFQEIGSLYDHLKVRDSEILFYL